MREQSHIAEGLTVPLFPNGTEELWQRREMVVAHLHPAGCERCDALREGLSNSKRALATQQAIALEPDEEHAERVARAFQVEPGEAAIGVADRFGRLYDVIDAHDASPTEIIEDVLSWVDFIQSQCEECGAPTW